MTVHSVRSWSRGLLACALCLALGVLAAPADAAIRIQAPTLSPAFRQSANDYVVNCDQPVSLSLQLTRGATARVAKGKWGGRSRTVTVPLSPGQAVRVHARRPRPGRSTYVIRCLPDDFPQFTYARYGNPAAPLYLFTPGSTGAAALQGGYAVVLTDRGTPIWWEADHASPFDAKVLPDGTFAWTHFQGGLGSDPDESFQIRRPDGGIVGQVRTVGSPTDVHELQQTEDGNFILLSYRPRQHVDTSAFNGDSDATVYDAVVQEVTPAGDLVREWSSETHVGLEETPAYRWEGLGSEPYDIVHANSVDPLPNGDFIISMRHTDSVYRVDGATGAIEWKLGGTPTAQSLTVQGDPVAYPLAGQHDARWLGHGLISIHDNGNGDSGGPRVVVYRISAGVATLVDSFGDLDAKLSFCCGSARSVGDHWLVSWGGIPLVAEYNDKHNRVFTIGLTGTGTSYRAVAIDGELTPRELRRGMDAQARAATGG